MEFIFWETLSGGKPVEDALLRMREKERDKVTRYLYLLNGSSLQEMTRQGYLEKIDPSGVYEFKVDFGKMRYRIFLAFLTDVCILLHMIIKDYKKLKRKDIELSVQRFKDYKSKLGSKI